ncbi:N-acyl-L-amino acid amidohydrolase [Virgibacillus profundi]|uniref:N-acyl-L-amino acid amidohydrolase n=2 Tax=Virgibacillus profundi TaxID=2024555 RepID=A0A2A2IHP5_9BACI|nr:amidohydrolase [Virgibacillus profundi]PAV31052.1 N-acyl-L-amino acid amidohydrolase [Virgibacillus profundi]PXY55238.1 amidohydrolase [Virgibacillus profundi]
MHQLVEQAINDRRYLHQHPELSGKEFETSKFIQKRLDDLGIETLNYEPPSVIGFLKGTKGDKTIALRADIDALPITEEGDKSYISQISGVAHACGHDGHTAILLAVAKWMSENQNEMEPNVMFIFQTSEEVIPSGAEHLVKLGVIDQVDAVFGLHLWQGMEKGKIGLAHGPMMASTDDFEIIIEGAGGHGSMPHETVDPIYVASHIVQGLQSIVSRKTDPMQAKVITVSQIESGSGYNIIPSSAKLQGTVRAFNLETTELIRSKMQQIVEGICGSFDAIGKLNYMKGTPPLINDSEQSHFVENVIRTSFGDDVFELVDPVMSGEDFSNYLLKKPGAFIFVGMNGEKSSYPHHHPRFDIDEDVFASSIELFINVIRNFN